MNAGLYAAQPVVGQRDPVAEKSAQYLKRDRYAIKDRHRHAVDADLGNTVPHVAQVLALLNLLRVDEVENLTLRSFTFRSSDQCIYNIIDVDQRQKRFAAARNHPSIAECKYSIRCYPLCPGAKNTTWPNNDGLQTAVLGRSNHDVLGL